MSKFIIQELVDEQTYKTYKENAWNLLDKDLVETLDALKDFFKLTMIINTWSFHAWQVFGNEKFSQRGYRSPNSTTGAKSGAHYKGMAADIDFYDNGLHIPANEMRKMIIDNRKQFPLIAGIEDQVNWVHIDVMKRAGYVQGKICVFDSKNNFRWI